MTRIHTKERIDIRLSVVAKQLLQQAAAASHKSVTEFLLHHGLNAASRTLADRHLFALNEKDWKAFQAVLDRPVKSKPRLRQLLSEKSILEP